MIEFLDCFQNTIMNSVSVSVLVCGKNVQLLQKTNSVLSKTIKKKTHSERMIVWFRLVFFFGRRKETIDLLI